MAIRWAILQLIHDDDTYDVATDRTVIDKELDLDDFQLSFQRHPQHPEHMQISINLSGAQWDEIRDLPIVLGRTL